MIAIGQLQAGKIIKEVRRNKFKQWFPVESKNRTNCTERKGRRLEEIDFPIGRTDHCKNRHPIVIRMSNQLFVSLFQVQAPSKQSIIRTS